MFPRSQNQRLMMACSWSPFPNHSPSAREYTLSSSSSWREGAYQIRGCTRRGLCGGKRDLLHEALPHNINQKGGDKAGRANE